MILSCARSYLWLLHVCLSSPSQSPPKPPLDCSRNEPLSRAFDINGSVLVLVNSQRFYGRVKQVSTLVERSRYRNTWCGTQRSPLLNKCGWRCHWWSRELFLAAQDRSLMTPSMLWVFHLKSVHKQFVAQTRHIKQYLVIARRYNIPSLPLLSESYSQSLWQVQCHCSLSGPAWTAYTEQHKVWHKPSTMLFREYFGTWYALL